VSAPAQEEFLDIVVEREKCCGFGNCVLAAPSVFALADQDGIVYALDPRPSVDLRADVEQAVADCPTEALGLRN
jgi:ferredoxin